MALNYDRAATILVEAAFFGDTDTSDRWGISTRTIQRYRSRMDDDDRLSLIFANKKTTFETKWANEIPAAIRSAVRFLQRAGKEADPRDPDAIHAVAGALKMLAEVRFTKDILDARLADFHRQDAIEGGQVATSKGVKQLTG